MDFITALLRPLVWLLCRILFRIKFYGVENVPLDGACVITPNHITFADPIWITIPIKRRVNYMAWDKPFEIPVLGFLMRVFGAFPIRLEAADTSAQREAAERLGRGYALVIFPEGGRTKTGRLMPFKMGAFRLALTHGAPIVPVTINGAYKIWPVGKWLPRPGKLSVTFHPPIPVERVTEEISKADLKEKSKLLASKTHAVVASALDPASLPEDESSAAATFETRA